VSVPAGFSFGLPVGITFMGTAFSEPTLIKLASGFEAATRVRQVPRFLPAMPLDEKQGKSKHSARGVRTPFTGGMKRPPSRPVPMVRPML
jgi:hypothetical protein